MGDELVKRIIMIGNAHIDPVWLWQWTEGYQEVRATFQSAIDRMDEYPDFVFTCDSSLFFEWVAESDPVLHEKIKSRVAEGRFQVIGGWWIEPDCNIPCGESFVRQALYGQRYLRETFGITATTGANLDSFGHNATIPQILAKSGCDSYVFLRPQRQEKELPAPLFRWASPDGSSVVAYRIPHEYCAPKDDIGEHVEKAVASLPPDGGEYAVFYGVGNHGGGPTIANLEQIEALNERGDLPPLELGSLRTFFDGVNGNLPVVRGELQHHGRGCYTTHSGIKRWNRRAENLLLRAEKWSSVAAHLDLRPYPREELTEAWKLLLFNQFHDTLAGTSIEPAYDDARDQLGHASSIATSAFNAAVQSIARQIAIDPEDDMRPVVVFNPHPWRVRTDVEIEYTWMRKEGAHVVDDEGQLVPMQTTRPLTTMSGLRARLVFPVDLPPLGYRTYRIRPGAKEQAGTEIPTPPIPRRAVVIDDQSDTWGHDVVAYDAQIGEFEETSRRTIEGGPVRTIVRVESRYGDSTLREDYLYSAGKPYVDVRVTIDWHERLKLLKLRYASPSAFETATFEIPYGYIERPADGEEQPGQAWVIAGGLAVMNDAKYGYDVRNGEIGISAVRSPVWAWHVPQTLDKNGDYEYMDQGRQRFTIRVAAADVDVVRLAMELNQQPFPLIETYHDGSLPQTASFGDDGGGGVVVAAVKEAEDGGAFVTRAFESAGRTAKARIAILGEEIEAEFGAHEIKTFVGSRETDLLE
ncbi:MAG TPA: glycoside hydrolase family 38 C-terminal domain-containing protein [Gaiellaceae bacterium]